ncbi:MAG: AMP-binding protein [Campylobacterota bacterium]|nr:AMP-binding protein [Campylobacterota bacterium]
MYLNELCNRLIHNNSLNIICDKKKYKELILEEYKKIKSYILHNFKGNEKLGIYLDKNYSYVITMLCSIELGITFIPLNKKWPDERNQLIINVSNCDYVISDSDLEFNSNIISYKTIQEYNIKESNNNFINLNNPIYVIFTSGSTGIPKGVEISRSAYENFTKWVNSYFNRILNKDRILNTADFTFDLSMLDIALLLSKELNFYISSFDNNTFKLLFEIEKYKISTIATVPNNINMLLSKDILKRGNISSLKYLLLGGARFSYGLYLNIIEKLNQFQVYNLYGPTEATVYCSAINLIDNKEEIFENSVSVGKPIDNMEIKIFNENSTIMPSYSKGEVYISGIQVMNKYINNKEQNKKVLVSIDSKLYYKTGDIGFIDENGNLFVVGRIDDTIKVKGYRINLSDIDSIITKLDFIEDCATISIEDKNQENKLITYFKLNKNISIKEIYKELNLVLINYQIPQEINIIKKFPLNTSGKISKKDLKKTYLNNRNIYNEN